MFFLFQCVPIASNLVTGCHWKQPGSVFAFSLQLFMYTEDLPWGFFSPGWRAQLSKPFFVEKTLQTLCHFCGPWLISVQHVNFFLVLESSEVDTAVQAWPHHGWEEEKDQLSKPAGHTAFYPTMISLMQRIYWVSLALYHLVVGYFTWKAVYWCTDQ